MPKKLNLIPVTPIADPLDIGIAVKKRAFNDISAYKEVIYSHRYEYHFFILVEKGNTVMEVDFEKYEAKENTVVFIHPHQVHRVLNIDELSFYLLAISNENLNPAYLTLLEELMPIKPLTLTSDKFTVLKHSASLCLDLYEETNDRFQLPLLKDSCNTLVGLIVSQFLEQSKPTERHSRFETVNKAFRASLEKNFVNCKLPSDYAKNLHLSTAYLNECVRNATGFSVTYHIQQRVILEAKRLLFHSDKTVKEIAAEIGYEDNAYFSRLFTKVTGTNASAFRNKNLE